MEKHVYIADCTPEGGIRVFALADGRLTPRQFVPLDRPMYLARENRTLYAVARAPFADGADSGITAYPIRPDGTLGTPGLTVSTEGTVCCHLSVHRGQVYDANYLSGSVNLLGVKTVRHHGSGPNLPRQDGPHVHYAGFSPDKAFVLVCDLGLDTVFVYDRDLNPVSQARVPAGHGVRHLAWAEDGRTVYSVNELASTLSVFDWNNGTLTYLDTVPALPESFSGVNTAAAIRISGRTLWVSHRGLDGIAEFDIGGRIPVFRCAYPTGGVSPRDFDIAGDVLIAANEGGSVTVLDRRSHAVVQTVSAGSPLCVLTEKEETI